MTAPIEWAGVAIRLTDGTVYAFEFQEGAEAAVAAEALLEDATPFGGSFRHMRATGDVVVDIHLHGLARHSGRFRRAADERAPHALDEQQRELPGAEQPEGSDRA